VALRADFTLTFRRLCDAAASSDADTRVRSLFSDPSSFDDWAAKWRNRLAEESGEANERRAAMRAANPLSSHATIWWRRRFLQP
jgi:serine/tyrosine/threonine adenylyltransferase